MTASCLVFFGGTCSAIPRRVMRDEDEADPKKPHPLSLWRKGDNSCEAQEHGPSEVDPDEKGRDDRYHHMHVSC